MKSSKLAEFKPEDFTKGATDNPEGGITGCLMQPTQLDGKALGEVSTIYICDLLAWVNANTDYELRGIVSVRDTGWFIGCELLDAKGNLVHEIEPQPIEGSIAGNSRMESIVYEASRRMTLNTIKWLIDNGHTKVGYAEGVQL